MVWKIERRPQSRGVGELMAIVNQKLAVMEARGRKIDEELAARDALETKIRMFAAEFGFEIEFCKSPICCRPFVPMMPHQKFHDPSCKIWFNNNCR